MTEEVYKKANQLQNDMKLIKYQLKEKNGSWISISTPYMKEARGSDRFQKELAEWLEKKQEEYQKEFDELECE